MLIQASRIAVPYEMTRRKLVYVLEATTSIMISVVIVIVYVVFS